MKILTLDPGAKERETDDLLKRRAEEQRRANEWAEFKKTLWYERVMEILSEEIRTADTLSALPNLRTAETMAELGSLVAVQRKVIAHLECIRQRFLQDG